MPFSGVCELLCAKVPEGQTHQPGPALEDLWRRSCHRGAHPTRRCEKRIWRWNGLTVPARTCDVSDNDDGPAWVEGLPTEPGTYWYFLWEPGTARETRRVRLGTAGEISDGSLMHIVDDFLSESRISKGRYGHIRVDVPEEPEFDRACPDCDGTGKRPGSSWANCYHCEGKAIIERPHP